MFAFNYEYLLKSIMSLVRDESDRIVSLGLATKEDVKGFVEPAIYGVVKKFSSKEIDKNAVLGAVSNIHDLLQSVKLPGDFEQVVLPDDEKICAVIELDIPVEEAVIEKEEDEEMEDEPEEDEVEDKNVTAACSFLENMAYRLGKNGNHSAAYLVERTIQNITGKLG